MAQAPPPQNIYLAALKEVLQARQAAVSFNEVTEPSAVDAAIKALTSSEQKYKELLRAGAPCRLPDSGYADRL